MIRNCAWSSDDARQRLQACQGDAIASQSTEDLITCNDNMALGAYRAIHEMGSGFRGYRGRELQRHSGRAVSWAALPGEDSGGAHRETASTVAGAPFGPRGRKRVVFGTEIVWRGSTAGTAETANKKMTWRAGLEIRVEIDWTISATSACSQSPAFTVAMAAIMPSGADWRAVVTANVPSKQASQVLVKIY